MEKKYLLFVTFPTKKSREVGISAVAPLSVLTPMYNNIPVTDLYSVYDF